jgi:RND family efflux transporter MFP subunit
MVFVMEVRRRSLLAAAALLVVLVACRRQEPAAEAPTPAVKTIAVSPEDLDVGRTLSGILSVGEETRLGFAIGGRLVEVPLREGDKFSQGQLIARLDPGDFERQRAASKARLAAARSRFAVAAEAFRRQTTLEQSGIKSRAERERALAAFESARSEVRVAEVDVADSEQQLSRTRLVAPRDGVVTRLMARRHEEIAAGQTVYEVGAEDAMEVSVLVPEQLVAMLAHDAPVEVTVPGLGQEPVGGRILEIGAAAEAGNAFRVKARLDRVPPGARSGMTASVRFPSGSIDETAVAIPLSALAFEQTETGPVVGRTAALFVLDEEEQRVRRREVSVSGIAGNRVVVKSGIAPGEQVVVAGVALLRDGQRARRWTPPE